LEIYRNLLPPTDSFEEAVFLRKGALDFHAPARIPTVQDEKLPAMVLIGKKIFYFAGDARMALDGYLSCASCHIEGRHDGRTLDFTDRGEGLRNTTTLLGKRGTGQGRGHWTANFDEIQDFEHDIRGAFRGHGFMQESDYSTGTRNTSLGLAKAGVSPELDALAAYVSSLDKVGRSPFRKADGQFTEHALAGKSIFERLKCAGCHSGPDFTDRVNYLRNFCMMSGRLNLFPACAFSSLCVDWIPLP
jgi:hypothetical protein